MSLLFLLLREPLRRRRRRYLLDVPYRCCLRTRCRELARCGGNGSVRGALLLAALKARLGACSPESECVRVGVEKVREGKGQGGGARGRNRAGAKDTAAARAPAWWRRTLGGGAPRLMHDGARRALGAGLAVRPSVVHLHCVSERECARVGVEKVREGKGQGGGACGRKRAGAKTPLLLTHRWKS